jgi:site-specific recombinase XerD
MLTVERRHTRNCPIRPKGGRVLNKCACPLRAVGTLKGERIRKTLDTINLEIAWRKVRAMEADLEAGRVRKPFSEAVEAFLTGRSVEPSTMRKYRRILSRLTDFASEYSIVTIDQLRLDHLDPYRAGRMLCDLSWQKELQLLRTFLEFCRKRKWCDENVAKEMEMPRDPKPKEREPYTQAEIIAILAAADTFGLYPYERLRARAMLLLLRYYGLRISDVATLRKDSVRGDEIMLRAVKNGKAIWHELYPVVRDALDALPLPKGASADCPYFFWTGLGDRDGHIKRVDRTLQAVFRKSGVKNAIAHRFRHTLATEILVNGGTIEDAANVLGDSPAVIRKHYARYSAEYQHRTKTLLRRVHQATLGTPVTHAEESDANSLKELAKQVVAEVGLEPTRTVKYGRF